MAISHDPRRSGRGGAQGVHHRGCGRAESVAGVLRVVVAAGLVVDGYVHADLAPAYAGGGEQGLFLVEAGVAVAAALLVLASKRLTVALVAAVVAGSALAAVVVSRYVDLGPVGPLPDLYEPVWYPEKLAAAGGEAVALLAAALLLALGLRRAGSR
jgi:hypothetical protein